jgi:hypothetical protein
MVFGNLRVHSEEKRLMLNTHVTKYTNDVTLLGCSLISMQFLRKLDGLCQNSVRYMFYVHMLVQSYPVSTDSVSVVSVIHGLPGSEN